MNLFFSNIFTDGRRDGHGRSVGAGNGGRGRRAIGSDGA